MGIGVSVFLLAVGAILAFAIDVSAEGVNLNTIGIILMIVGAIGLLVSLVMTSQMTRNRGVAGETVIREERY